MAHPVTEAKTVVKDPEICGGDPILEGTRVRVSDVVVAVDHRGWTAEEVVQEFPSLRIQDVYAALTYYYERPEEIRQEIQAREQAFARDA